MAAILPVADSDRESLIEELLQALEERRAAKRAPKERPLFQLWDEWIPTLKAGSSIARSRPGMRRFLEQAFAVRGEEVRLGDLLPSQVDLLVFEAWQRALAAENTGLGRPPSDGYLDTVQMAVSACLSFHVKTGELVRNPFRGLPRLPGRAKRRQGHPNPDEMERVCAALPALQAAILFVEYRTLQRVTSIRCLKKHHVDWVRRDIMPVVKGGKQIRVPCPDDALEVIRKFAETSRSEYVFANPRDPKGRPLPYTTYHHAIERAREALGLNPAGEAFTSHHARHAGAKELARRKPISFVQHQLGHGDLRTTSIYLGMSEELTDELREALNDMAPKKTQGPR